MHGISSVLKMCLTVTVTLALSGAIILTATTDASAKKSHRHHKHKHRHHHHGLIADLMRRTGVKKIQTIANQLDDAHAALKRRVKIYGQAEEALTKMVKTPAIFACEAPYQAITNAVMARCSNWEGRLEDRDQLADAVDNLIDARIFNRNDFNHVDIRWCPLSLATGMAPDRGKIYIASDYKGADIDALSALIAHEMTHVRQYARMGSDSFKCKYSQYYVACEGCQNERHPLEAEAYKFQDDAYDKLIASAEAQRTANEPSAAEDDSAPTEVEVCNETSQTAHVAIGYEDDNNPNAIAWWDVAAHTCTGLGQRFETPVFAYATTDISGTVGAKEWLPTDSTTPFCRSRTSIKNSSEEPCKNSDANYEWIEMGALPTGVSGRITWSLN